MRSKNRYARGRMRFKHIAKRRIGRFIRKAKKRFRSNRKG